MKENKPQLSIVVLTYNCLEYTQKCLKSIKENLKASYELIVIDNNSSDKTQEFLKKKLKNKEISKLILNKENNGVAIGRNQGIELAEGEIIIFLDNDTEVYKGYDKLILDEFEKDPKLGVIGTQGANVTMYNPILFEPKDGYVDVVPGFSYIFRRELIGKIGTQYTDFPNNKFWHEDLEFSRRVKLAGYKILSLNQLPIKHYGHKSTGENVDAVEMIETIPGFFENAKIIEQRFISKNILFVHAPYSEKMNNAFFKILVNLVDRLRKLGLIVIWRDKIHSNVLSFDLCNAANFKYNGSRIATFFIENDRPPKSWEKEMKLIDYVLPGSRWAKYACRNEGYKNKLKNVFPGGIDLNIYNLNIKPLNMIDGFNLKNKFLFLHNGASQPRKNTENLITWYTEVFKDNKEVVLLIKDGGYGYIEETKNLILKLSKDKHNPKILHVTKLLEENELASLYRRCAINGAYYAPHRAEGFGLPQLEALACGCRIGTSDIGGPKYNLRDDKSKVLKGVTLFSGKMVISKFHNWTGEPFYKDNEKPLWLEPNESEVKKWLRKIVVGRWSERDQANSNKFANENFNYDIIAKKIYTFLKEKL